MINIITLLLICPNYNKKVLSKQSWAESSSRTSPKPSLKNKSSNTSSPSQIKLPTVKSPKTNKANPENSPSSDSRMPNLLHQSEKTTITLTSAPPKSKSTSLNSKANPSTKTQRPTIPTPSRTRCKQRKWTKSSTNTNKSWKKDSRNLGKAASSLQPTNTQKKSKKTSLKSLKQKARRKCSSKKSKESHKPPTVK